MPGVLDGLDNKVVQVIVDVSCCAEVCILQIRDVDEMVFTDPSGNTDQGVYLYRKYLGVKTLMRNESKGVVWH